MRGTFTALVLLSAALALSACPDDKLQRRCRSDTDCGAHNRCELSTGTCLCRTAEACPSGQICSAGGKCRVNVGCSDSLECPLGQVCDTGQKSCVAPGECTSDIQCPLGQICDSVGASATFLCKNGCRDTSDCPQGPARQACADPAGAICACPLDADRASCPRGVLGDGGFSDAAVAGPCSCQPGLCTDTSFCPYGDLCVPEGGTGKPICVPATDADHPYCQQCMGTPGSGTCGGGANYCVIDTSGQGGGSYCGVDCSQGQACPSGYFCDFVIVLTQWLCHRVDPNDLSSAPNDAECNRQSGVSCASNDDCPGARCNPSTGQCGGRCTINEGEPSGFCTCASDGECPRDQCVSTTRLCALSRQPCDPADPTACNDPSSRIYCANVNGTNGCVIGKNCAPLIGLSCNDLPR